MKVSPVRRQEPSLVREIARRCTTERVQPRYGAFWGNSAAGAAVDIGTTTLAATLMTLQRGMDCRRILGKSPTAYGADVLSRIQAANEGGGRGTAP